MRRKKELYYSNASIKTHMHFTGRGRKKHLVIFSCVDIKDHIRKQICNLQVRNVTAKKLHLLFAFLPFRNCIQTTAIPCKGNKRKWLLTWPWSWSRHKEDPPDPFYQTTPSMGAVEPIHRNCVQALYHSKNYSPILNSARSY